MRSRLQNCLSPHRSHRSYWRTVRYEMAPDCTCLYKFNRSGAVRTFYVLLHIIHTLEKPVACSFRKTISKLPHKIPFLLLISRRNNYAHLKKHFKNRVKRTSLRGLQVREVINVPYLAHRNTLTKCLSRGLQVKRCFEEV